MKRARVTELSATAIALVSIVVMVGLTNHNADAIPTKPDPTCNAHGSPGGVRDSEGVAVTLEQARALAYYPIVIPSFPPPRATLTSINVPRLSENQVAHTVLSPRIVIHYSDLTEVSFAPYTSAFDPATMAKSSWAASVGLVSGYPAFLGRTHWYNYGPKASPYFACYLVPGEVMWRVGNVTTRVTGYHTLPVLLRIANSMR